MEIAHRTGARRKCRRKEHPPRNDIGVIKEYNIQYLDFLIRDRRKNNGKRLHQKYAW